MIDVVQEGSTIVITVQGHLDGASGHRLLEESKGAVGAAGVTRLDIDLRELTSYSLEGADALVACRTVGAHLPEGLHYRTGRGAGRSALLEAYRAADTGEMRAISIGENYQR